MYRIDYKSIYNDKNIIEGTIQNWEFVILIKPITSLVLTQVLNNCNVNTINISEEITRPIIKFKLTTDQYSFVYPIEWQNLIDALNNNQNYTIDMRGNSIKVQCIKCNSQINYVLVVKFQAFAARLPFNDKNHLFELFESIKKWSTSVFENPLFRVASTSDMRLKQISDFPIFMCNYRGNLMYIYIYTNYRKIKEFTLNLANRLPLLAALKSKNDINLKYQDVSMCLKFDEHNFKVGKSYNLGLNMDYVDISLDYINKFIECF